MPSSSSSSSLCGSIVTSQRGLLALQWNIVTSLTALAFLIALAFAFSADTNSNNNTNNYYYDDDASNTQQQQNNNNNNSEPQVAVTSRAMAFAALWTAVVALLLGVFGTVILGFQSPTGQYYTCCSPSVHQTTQLGLGSFIGALIMFANLTLVCAVLFGEFQIRDYDRRDGEPEDADADYYSYNDDDNNNSSVDRRSMAFSIMCAFLTILYAGFATLTWLSVHDIMEENANDLMTRPGDMRRNSRSNPNFMSSGYIGERFDVRRSGSAAGTFVPPTPPKEGSVLT